MKKCIAFTILHMNVATKISLTLASNFIGYKAPFDRNWTIGILQTTRLFAKFYLIFTFAVIYLIAALNPESFINVLEFDRSLQIFHRSFFFISKDVIFSSIRLVFIEILYIFSVLSWNFELGIRCPLLRCT